MNDAEYKKQRFLCENGHISYFPNGRVTEIMEKNNKIVENECMENE